jgi:protein-tyrosine phosphatase
MDWITETIAIGDIDDALALERLQSAGISAILGLNDFPTISYDARFLWRRVQLFDGPGNAVDDIVRALATLDEFVAGGHRVLVHCREGVSRAPFVTACYLAQKGKLEFEDALAQVAARRQIANPHPGLRLLWLELRDVLTSED